MAACVRTAVASPLVQRRVASSVATVVCSAIQDAEQRAGLQHPAAASRSAVASARAVRSPIWDAENLRVRARSVYDPDRSAVAASFAIRAAMQPVRAVSPSLAAALESLAQQLAARPDPSSDRAPDPDRHHPAVPRPLRISVQPRENLIVDRGWRNLRCRSRHHTGGSSQLSASTIVRSLSTACAWSLLAHDFEIPSSAPASRRFLPSQ